MAAIGAQTIDVQTIGARKSSLEALAKPKVLQPPTGDHGHPRKCAACNGAGVIDSFYKHALLFHDDQRNTAYSCCSSPALCCWMSFTFFACDCCPCCCCEDGMCDGCCCCFSDKHLRECLRGQLIPGKKVSCPSCLGEGWVRFDGNAKADGEGLIALGRVKFFVKCPGRLTAIGCDGCREIIPFGRNIELYHRAPGYDLCIRCAEAGAAQEERDTCTRITVYERFRQDAFLRDRLRLFHETALPNIDGFTYETDQIQSQRKLQFGPDHTLPNGACKHHVGYQMRVGSFRVEDFGAVGIEWSPPAMPPAEMERT